MTARPSGCSSPGNIPPIAFESLSPSDYLRYLVDIHTRQDILDELETRYEDGPFDKGRAAEVALIGTDTSPRAYEGRFHT